MKDARQLKLVIKDRSTGLTSEAFPLEYLLDHAAEIPFLGGDTLPVSDLIYFSEDYDIYVDEKLSDPNPFPFQSFSTSVSTGSSTISLKTQAEPPKFARLGNPETGSAMRLKVTEGPEYFYWRDAGVWGVPAVQKDGANFYTVCKAMAWLDDLQLFPISEEEYAAENRPYYKSDPSDDDFVDEDYIAY